MVFLNEFKGAGGGFARVESVVADQELSLTAVEPACFVELRDRQLGAANLIRGLGAVGAGEGDGEADLDRAVLRTQEWPAARARLRRRRALCGVRSGESWPVFPRRVVSLID